METRTKLNAHQIEKDLQREFMLCPECGKNVHTKPAEKIPAQTLRACDECGAAFFMDLDAKPNYEPAPAPRIEADDDPTRSIYAEGGKIVVIEGGQQVAEWGGSPDPADPDNYWIDDKTGERVSAKTGERSRIEAEATARPWHFETCLYKNSADAEYRIMGTNEDAGKTGVSYSGRFLAIATTESREDALLIVRAVNSHQALVDAVRSALSWMRRAPIDEIEAVEAALGENAPANELEAALALAEGNQ